MKKRLKSAIFAKSHRVKHRRIDVNYQNFFLNPPKKATAICYLMICICIGTGQYASAADKTSPKTGGTSPTAESIAPADPDIKEIVDKIQSYYSAAQDYQASFVQTTSHKLFAGKLQRAYGTVKFKKGGLMRWEYERPEKKLFVYDGKTLWIYEPEVPQVFSGSADAERLRRALAFLSGDGGLLNEYSIKKLNSVKYGFKTGIVLGLTPKNTQSPYKRIELYLDASTYRVARSVVVDHEGNRNRLDFNNPKLGLGLPASEFSFTPPKGVPVIDPTKPQ